MREGVHSFYTQTHKHTRTHTHQFQMKYKLKVKEFTSGVTVVVDISHNAFQKYCERGRQYVAFNLLWVHKLPSCNSHTPSHMIVAHTPHITTTFSYCMSMWPTSCDRAVW